MSKFYESDYEEALIQLLEEQGWQYTYGGELHRNNREVLLTDDLKAYLQGRYTELTSDDMRRLSTTCDTQVVRPILSSFVIHTIWCVMAIATHAMQTVRYST